MKPEEVKIHALVYGDYPDLHRHVLGILTHKPEVTQALLWLNEPGAESLKIIEQFCRNPSNNTRYVHEPGNTHKYVAMRRMFSKLTNQKWVVWFDDDSRLELQDNGTKWFDQMREYIEARENENICYVGQPWFVDYLPGQMEFIKQSSWYKGLPPKMRGTRPIVEFAQGSYWWLRRDVQELLDWPDPRLEHNGGDTLLGEAVRQQGLPFHKFWKGIRPNGAKRRGFHQRPAGSTVDCRR